MLFLRLMIPLHSFGYQDIQQQQQQFHPQIPTVAMERKCIPNLQAMEEEKLEREL
jgi:hypothetical protein